MAQLTIQVTRNGQPTQAQVRIIHENSIISIIKTNDMGVATIPLALGNYIVIATDGFFQASAPLAVTVDDDTSVTVNIPTEMLTTDYASIRYKVQSVVGHTLVPQPDIDITRYTDSTHTTIIETHSTNSAGYAEFTLTLSSNPQTCYFVIEFTSYEVIVTSGQSLTINHILT